MWDDFNVAEINVVWFAHYRVTVPVSHGSLNLPITVTRQPPQSNTPTSHHGDGGVMRPRSRHVPWRLSAAAAAADEVAQGVVAVGTDAPITFRSSPSATSGAHRRHQYRHEVAEGISVHLKCSSISSRGEYREPWSSRLRRFWKPEACQSVRAQPKQAPSSLLAAIAFDNGRSYWWRVFPGGLAGLLVSGTLCAHRPIMRRRETLGGGYRPAAGKLPMVVFGGGGYHRRADRLRLGGSRRLRVVVGGSVAASVQAP